MSGVNAASEKALQEALGRLAEGRPLRSKGDLTVAGLAVEAGVSRSTANRSVTAVEALRALQLRRSSSVEPERPISRSGRAAVSSPSSGARHAEKVAVLELSIDTLAQHVQALTLDNERLRRALADPRGNVPAHRSPKGGA